MQDEKKREKNTGWTKKKKLKYKHKILKSFSCVFERTKTSWTKGRLRSAPYYVI
jgi:hypothetical protein